MQELINNTSCRTVVLISGEQPNINEKDFHKVDNFVHIDITKEDFGKVYSTIKGLFRYCYANGSYIFLDTETTGLDPFKNEVVLLTIGRKHIQIVIDYSACKAVGILPTHNEDYRLLFIELEILLEGLTVIGHNLKFDWKMLNRQGDEDSIDFRTMHDTMIAEQRLYKGFVTGYALDDLCMRYYGGIPYGMNDGIGKTFKPKQHFSTYQIQYAADDIECLEKIYLHQLEAIKTFNMQFLLNEIEFPLIRVLGKAENTGLVLDVDKVRELLKSNIQKRFELECELDEEVRFLREWVCPPDNQIYLKGGKYDRQRKQTFVTTLSLFDDIGHTDDVTNDKAYINYSSPTEILTILGRLGLEVPDKNKSEPVRIVFQGKKPTSYYGDTITTDEKVFQQFLIENPNYPASHFIELLFLYREYDGLINKYGEKFIDNINPITKRIHTIYRQCTTENARLASGGGKNDKDKFQSQNLPAKNDYRSIFRYKEGYSILTIDLAGAEVTIMSDKANDNKLFDLAMKGDIHSHIATLGWRNIYKSRGLAEEAKTFTVSKTQNKELRRTGKNLTFGGIYGCGAKKAGKTIGVSPVEGKIYIDTLKAEFPKTFKMVESNVNFALSNGFIINNTRTNSRLWFKVLYDAVREKRELTWEEIDSISGQAKNIPISGTQADMLKEAMVVIDREIGQNDWDCGLLLQVHDELVYYVPKELDGVSEEYKKNPYKFDFPAFVKKTVTDTANKYLTNIKMDAEYVVADTWVK
jgi:DNA polymerase I-like protein with 3'-5' exonuclease and polymerase domains